MDKFEAVSLHGALDMQISNKDVYHLNEVDGHILAATHVLYHKTQYYKKIEPIKMFMNVNPSGHRHFYAELRLAENNGDITSKCYAEPVYIIPCSVYDDE